MTYWRKNYI